MKDSTKTTVKTAQKTLVPSIHPYFFSSEIVTPIITSKAAEDKRIIIINSHKDSFKKLRKGVIGSSKTLLTPKYSFLNCSFLIPSSLEVFNFWRIFSVPPKDPI